jgi:hypothetical protein
MAKTKNAGGLRRLLIHGMTRQQQIDFIKRHDSFYQFVDFAGHDNEQVRKIALSVDSVL